MREMDQDLIEKGMREPREGLRDEAMAHVGIGRKYPTELLAVGWSSERTDEIEALAASLGSRVAQQAEAKAEAHAQTATERAAVANAKDLIGKTRLGVSLPVSSGRAPATAKEKLEAGHALRQSTPKIAMYLEKILPTVASLDDQLAIYFGGERPSTLLASARSALDAAEQTQEGQKGSVPRETLEIYEAKGLLLCRIEEMNKVGKIAFYGQSDVAGLFNKDVLNRARKTRTKTETGKTSA
jgi:hypothetical protein